MDCSSDIGSVRNRKVHVIYLLSGENVHPPVGKKVGCTNSIKRRLERHRKRYGDDVVMEVLEELIDSSDQEASERERHWQDKLGLRKDSAPYSASVKAAVIGGKVMSRRHWDEGTGLAALSREQRLIKSAAANAAQKRLGSGRYDRQLQRSLSLRAVQSPNHICKIVSTCPHCNLTGKGPNMVRYHFDNCKKAYWLSLLNDVNWDINSAAAVSGMARATVYRQIKTLGISPAKRISI